MKTAWEMTPDERAAEEGPLQCRYEFPLPTWMGADQDDPCRCDLTEGHDGGHSCGHLRGEITPD